MSSRDAFFAPEDLCIVPVAFGLRTKCTGPPARKIAGLRMTNVWNEAKPYHFGTLSTVIFLIRLFFAFILLYNPTKLREY